MTADAGCGCSLDAVGERVEGVAEAQAPPARTAVGLGGGDLAGFHAVLLTRADAPGGAVLDQHDGVRLDPADEAPGQLGVGPLGVGRLPLGDDAPVGPGRGEAVRVLDEEATADLAKLQGLGGRRRRGQDAGVLAACR